MVGSSYSCYAEGAAVGDCEPQLDYSYSYRYLSDLWAEQSYETRVFPLHDLMHQSFSCHSSTCSQECSYSRYARVICGSARLRNSSVSTESFNSYKAAHSPADAREIFQQYWLVRFLYQRTIILT
eukprot:IDg8156t1